MVNKISYPGRKELAYENTILRKAIAKTKKQQRQMVQSLCTIVSLRPLSC